MLQVQDKVSQKIKPPFKFFKFRLTVGGVVAKAWREAHGGSHAERITKLLRKMRSALSQWNKKVVGNLFEKAKHLEEQIQNMQEEDVCFGGLNTQLQLHLSRKVAEHTRMLKQQELYWRQKSMVKWLREGDQNTAFFHQSTIIRRRWNKISSITDGHGQEITDENGITTVMTGHFHSLWQSLDLGYEIVLPSIHNTITAFQNRKLVAQISENEITEALSQL
ncbi:uncharacterized protein [Elaeis guineensis]|uniref:uncharacterized protein n=1 Tax=Elaeis guineensis var. tenera TaxID=51953 RepID=UPI003C6DAE03